MEDKLQTLDTELKQTKARFDETLIEQEHRLISAVFTLCDLLLRASPERRKQCLPAAIKALLWCLIPSPGTTTVGSLALITLLVTMYQASLLQTQNDKIEIQNILAEAERRSALMFETVAIFDQIEKEKSQVETSHLCGETLRNGCWNQKSTEQGMRKLFVPSIATIGRLAALTQALRPYRYLEVEISGPSQILCQSETSSIALATIYNGLLAASIDQAPGSLRGPVPVGMAKEIAENSYAEANTKTFEERLSFLAKIIQRLVGSESSNAYQLNCEASSPERGQLLVSLHAAGVDISAIEKGGGNFTYADIPGANLAGIVLEGVSLNHAKLPGASFSNALLDEVHFREADLTGARFSGASISNSDFEAARIQTFFKPGDAPIHFLPLRGENLLISGMQFYESSQSPNLLKRLCLSLQLPSAFTLTPYREKIDISVLSSLSFFDVNDYALLLEETSVSGSSMIVQKAVLMFGVDMPRVTLYESLDASSYSITYIPVSECLR